MELAIGRWLLKQLNTDDALDAVVVSVKLAVSVKGKKTVATELRRMADSLENGASGTSKTFRKSA